MHHRAHHGEYGECCEPHHHSHHHGHEGCCQGSWRRFTSKAEKRKHLEKYKEELEAELAAVKEILAEMAERCGK